MTDNDRSDGDRTGADDRGGRVIVGVDGSDGAQIALDWAASKQDVLGPVTALAAYHIDSLVDGIGTSSIYNEMIDAVRGDAEAQLARALAGARASHQIADNGQVVRGHPGPALVAAAEGQRLLVVGSRGRSALVETLLGSVASYCVKHAPGPVAVIPHDTPTDEPLRHLVVGVDGSANADAALRWAAAHVAPGGRITALTCRVPAPYALELVPPPPLPFTELRGMAERAIARSIPDAEAEIEVELTDGDPRVVLRDAAAERDLLVVGARGHRGAAYLLVGSVATSLAHHPTVPTIVVPAD